MLSPQDIEKRNFTRVMRGYNTDEVDRYIDFLCEKYALIYRENQELQFKLNAVADSAALGQKTQNDAANALITAKTTADEIIANAKEESALLYKTAKVNANKELRRFREQVIAEARELIRLRKLSAMLREEIVEAYTRGISNAQSLTPEGRYDRAEQYADALVESLLEKMKDDISAPVEVSKEVHDKKSKPTAKKSSASVKFKSRSVKDAIKEINRQLKTEAQTQENEKTEE